MNLTVRKIYLTIHKALIAGRITRFKGRKSCF